MNREEFKKQRNNAKTESSKLVVYAKYVDSLEEQIQGLQSLLDLKQQEISVLESKVEDEAKQAYIQGSKDSHEAWKRTLHENFGIKL